MRMQDNTEKNNNPEEVECPENVEMETEEQELDPQSQMEADVLKWKELAMRSAAELENYRKRMAREKADAIRFGNQRLIEDLLPILDNFNMGMTAAEQDSNSIIYKGMEMVQGQLDGFLAAQGVTEETPAPGDEFDPNKHDAMMQEVSDEFEDGQIIRVLRKGYKMGDRLIRPANVVVAKSDDSEAADDAEAAE